MPNPMKRPMQAVLSAATLVVVAGLAGCSDTKIDMDSIASRAVDNPVTLAAKAGEWVAHGLDYNEQRYSPLKQITVDNVSQLGLAWYGDPAERGGSYESTPIIADGRIFITSPWSKLYAFDIRTGKQLWK